MCVSGEKSTEKQVGNPPETRKKPETSAHDAVACASPSETLIERVVDFMDTYNEN